MPTFHIKGTRRVQEQVSADIEAVDLATAAAAFVAGLEAGTLPVSVLGSTVVAGTARAAKLVRQVEDNIP